MNSEYSSRKQFISMFCQAMKLTSVMAVLALLCFMFLTVLEYDMYEPDSFRRTAHFFNDLRWNGIQDQANLAFIGAGLLNGMLCFNFAWSKKQINVVLSLGMKKSDIYFAKILGGIVPMGITFLLAGVAETISNAAGNYVVDQHFFAMAAFTMLQYLAIYILSFALSSAVMANAGNVVESVIFTVILGVLPMAVKSFLTHTFWQLTHGAYIPPHYSAWNWSKPFNAFEGLDYEFMQTYFYNTSATLPSISIKIWSGAITAFVYAVAVIMLGYLGFKKRRNEICGTWGRAKGMNEIVGAVTGFYAAYFIRIFIFREGHGDASILTYLTCCGSFVAAYVIFKLIFGYKRKKEFKAAINRVPVYAMGLAAVFMIFGLGLFGYSSKIPEAAEIKSVTVSSPFYKFLDENFSGSSEYALKISVKGQYDIKPDLYGKTLVTEGINPTITFSEYTDIEKIINIHESFIRDGKIKNNGAHACASDVMITYKLKNGKEITRYYTEATEGTTLKLLTLNDSSAFNKILFDYLSNGIAFEYEQDYIINKNEEGYLEITDDGEYINPSAYDKIVENFVYHQSSVNYLAYQPCYIFPTDMSSGYKLGYIDKELYNAIITDLKNISANQYFNHSAGDEIGILSFGLSKSTHMLINSYPYSIGEATAVTGEVLIEDDKIIEEESSPDGTFHKTSWNVNSHDIKSVVITKDMKNTIEYLEEHDLMQYFKRTLKAENVKYVKLATMGELCKGYYDKTDMFPMFYGGFWTSQQMSEWKEENSMHKYYNYLFENIHNEITDRNQIKKLLDEGVVFGYCAGNSRVMEITYKDGSVATVMVRADAPQ